MLVSSIARFTALNNMNNAAFGMMQTSNQMMNSMNNANTFGGEHDLSMLNKMDNKMSMDLASNNLLYKVSYLQEKMAAKHQDNSINCNKKSLNLLA